MFAHAAFSRAEVQAGWPVCCWAGTGGVLAAASSTPLPTHMHAAHPPGQPVHKNARSKPHPSFLNASSVWKLLPWPLPPQMPRMSGTRVEASNEPCSTKKFLAMCMATASRNLGAT